MKVKTPRSLDPTDGVCAILIRDIPHVIAIKDFSRKLLGCHSVGDVSNYEKTNVMYIDTSSTRYNLIRLAASRVGWKESEGNFPDIVWIDTAITPSMVRELQGISRINHFPGMQIICKKLEFALAMEGAKKLFPKQYRFIPKTYTSYAHYIKSAQQLAGSMWYIAKPDAGCMGKGVYLTHNPKREHFTDDSVLQEYVKRPLLIDGHKFDMRLFVVVWSVSPLTLYIHKKGFLRLCTEQYQLPSKQNYDNMLIHLTNYAINKSSKKYAANSKYGGSESGSKRSLDFLFNYIETIGGDSDKVWDEICSLIVKTVLPVASHLNSVYCRTFSDDPNQRCFEVLGFDVLLDRELNPWLLEVNHRPSLSCQSDFDYHIKKNLIEDVLRLLSVSSTSRPASHLVPEDLQCVYPTCSDQLSLIYRDIENGLSDRKLSSPVRQTPKPPSKNRTKSPSASVKPLKWRPQSSGLPTRNLLNPPKLQLHSALSSTYRNVKQRRSGSAGLYYTQGGKYL